MDDGRWRGGAHNFQGGAGGFPCRRRYPQRYPSGLSFLNSRAKPLILMVGAQGFEPWTR
jgi:hypothetical protein